MSAGAHRRPRRRRGYRGRHRAGNTPPIPDPIADAYLRMATGSSGRSVFEAGPIRIALRDEPWEPADPDAATILLHHGYGRLEQIAKGPEDPDAP